MNKTQKVSAGIIPYRYKMHDILIVHPSGHPDAPWSIAKGIVENGETPEQAARREYQEETGLTPPVVLHLVGEVIYPNGKKVIAFLGQLYESDEEIVKSWEIDRAEFMGLDDAKDLLQNSQKEFIPIIQKMLEW